MLKGREKLLSHCRNTLQLSGIAKLDAETKNIARMIDLLHAEYKELVSGHEIIGKLREIESIQFQNEYFIECAYTNLECALYIAKCIQCQNEKTKAFSKLCEFLQPVLREQPEFRSGIRFDEAVDVGLLFKRFLSKAAVCFAKYNYRNMSIVVNNAKRNLF